MASFQKAGQQLSNLHRSMCQSGCGSCVCVGRGGGSLSAAAAVPELHLSPEGAAIGGILSLRLKIQDAYSLGWMVLPS